MTDFDFGTIRYRATDIKYNGQVHNIHLNPHITYEMKNGINVVKYGSIDFPDGPLPQTSPFTNDMQIYYPVVEAFSHDAAEILSQMLPKRQGKLLVRGVSSGDLEKTIENKTDRWDPKDALAPSYEGNPRQYTFARPSQDSSVDSLRNALNPRRDFTAVGPIYRLLGGRLVQIDAYKQVRRFFRFDGAVYPDARETLDKMVGKETTRTTMILVFDGSNAVTVKGKAEGYGPYKFEGDPHLLTIVQFDLNYPRSVSKIDHEFLFKGVEDYMRWLRNDARWKFFYRYGERGPVRFRMYGDGVKYVHDDSQDAEYYEMRQFERELSDKISDLMNRIISTRI